MTDVRGRADGALADAGRPLTNWTESQAASLTTSVVRTSHRLGELDLFADDALADVLDRHPRQQLQAFTMGSDPTRDEWGPVEIGSASGDDMLAAVHAGRLWLNVLDVDRAHGSYARLQARLFAELAGLDFDVLPGTPHSSLLISSPHATVDYQCAAPRREPRCRQRLAQLRVRHEAQSPTPSRLRREQVLLPPAPRARTLDA